MEVSIFSMPAWRIIEKRPDKPTFVYTQYEKFVTIDEIVTVPESRWGIIGVAVLRKCTSGYNIEMTPDMFFKKMEQTDKNFITAVKQILLLLENENTCSTK